MIRRGPCDLVDRTAVGPSPTAPLPAVDVVEIAEAVALDGRLPARGRQERLAVDGQHAVAHAQFIVIAVGVVVPDMHAVLDQIADVGIAPQKPEQLVDHPFQEDLLGGQQRESFAEVETHLVAEDAARAGSRAVAPHDAFVANPAQQIEVLFHDVTVV